MTLATKNNALIVRSGSLARVCACCLGACCESNGTCSVKPQEQCQGFGRLFKGEGTTCGPTTCSCNSCLSFEIEYKGKTYPSTPGFTLAGGVDCENTSSNLNMTARYSALTVGGTAECGDSYIVFSDPYTGQRWGDTAPSGSVTVLVTIDVWCSASSSGFSPSCSQKRAYLYRFPAGVCPSGTAQLVKEGSWTMAETQCSSLACNKSCWNFSADAPVVRFRNPFP